jgi:hypothetical protein
MRLARDESALRDYDGALCMSARTSEREKSETSKVYVCIPRFGRTNPIGHAPEGRLDRIPRELRCWRATGRATPPIVPRPTQGGPSRFLPAKFAEKARVGLVTVRQLEVGAHRPRRATLEVIRQCLEAAGWGLSKRTEAELAFACATHSQNDKGIDDRVEQARYRTQGPI